LIADNEESRDRAMETNAKVPEDAITGAQVGAVAGGTLALLVGLNALALPGVGTLIAAGPLLASLAGLGAGAAVGGLVGALVGLLSVHCVSDEEILRARDLLTASGAEDITSSGEEAINIEDKDLTYTLRTA
jgi:hypothetical protein